MFNKRWHSVTIICTEYLYPLEMSSTVCKLGCPCTATAAAAVLGPSVDDDDDDDDDAALPAAEFVVTKLADVLAAAACVFVSCYTTVPCHARITCPLYFVN